MRDRLCYSRLPRFASIETRSSSQRDAPLVSSQSFPHLWKKLWKIPEICATPQRFARFRRIYSRGEGRKSHEIGPFGQSLRVKARNIVHRGRRNLAEGLVC